MVSGTLGTATPLTTALRSAFISVQSSSRRLRPSRRPSPSTSPCHGLPHRLLHLHSTWRGQFSFEFVGVSCVVWWAHSIVPVRNKRDREVLGRPFEPTHRPRTTSSALARREVGSDEHTHRRSLQLAHDSRPRHPRPSSPPPPPPPATLGVVPRPREAAPVSLPCRQGRTRGFQWL